MGSDIEDSGSEKLDIKDLELKLSSLTGGSIRDIRNKSLKNEIFAKDGKNTVVYIGEAYNLRFNGINNIKGYARLTKYKKANKKKNKIISWLPFEREIKEVPHNIKVWCLSPYTDYGYYFIKNGKPVKTYDASDDYRTKLRDYAISRGLKLSHKLFEAVFNPIEEELMKIQKEVQAFK